MEDMKTFRFEASHILPKHPGKCSNLHGHSWVLHVFVEGPVNEETGMVMDYADIKAAVQPLIDDLDHSHLGAWKTDKVEIIHYPGSPCDTKRVPWLYYGDKWKEFNPTSENLVMAIGVELSKKNFRFARLVLKETEDTACVVGYGEVIAHRVKTEGLTHVEF